MPKRGINGDLKNAANSNVLSFFWEFCRSCSVLALVFSIWYQQSLLYIILSGPQIESYQWQFPIKGCFKSQNHSSIPKIALKISSNAPPSLLELTLRLIYQSCFHPQVFRSMKWEYKRVPRKPTPFGRWLLFEDLGGFEVKNEPLSAVMILPLHLIKALKKGPGSFCCWCTRGLFKEALRLLAAISLPHGT